MKIGLLGNSDVCYNSLNYFMDCIEEALHSRGIHTQRITDAANINHTQDGPWSAIIGINQYQPAARTQDGSYVLDSFQCPVFNILVDPPYYHHGKLESHMDNLTLYLLDQGHVEYCKRYYPPFKHMEMVYLPGPSGSFKSYDEKEIDVLFTGTLDGEEAVINRMTGSVDWAERDNFFYLLIKTRLVHPEMTTLEAMLFLTQHMGIHGDDTLKMLMASLGASSDLYLRMHYRREMIRTLVDAGIRVHVAGSGWEALYPVCPENLVLEGTMDFQQTASLAANTKILLNSMLSFKNGIHDRVLTAMQNGAVCVTDSSSYIDAHFQNNHDIVLYDVKNMNMLPDIIRELLENPEKAREIAQNGRQKALSNFTWDNFVKKYILERLD